MSVRAAGLARLIVIIVLGGLVGGLLGAGLSRAATKAVPNTVPGGFPVASDVRVAGDDAQTRMVIDLSQKIDARVFTLANPYRVVIDLPQVTFNLSPQAGEGSRGLIKAFRFGLMMTGGSRIVIDLARPAQVQRSYALDPANDQPARLVIDLAAVDRDTFMRNVAIENHQRDAAAPTAKPPAKSDSRPLIVLDPGHGGIDNGTKSTSGDLEKSIVLDFALLLRVKIEKAGKYRVVMTRSDDTFVALVDRVQFARSQQAALFMSIHADALPKGEGDAQGATIYTLSETASDAEAARLAETENRADVIAGVDLTAEPDDVADILIDLAQRETKTFSMQFARGLVDSMRPVARMHKNALKSAGFRVLKAPDIPSVLVELGYVSNKQDLKSLTSQDWRDHTSGAMLQAIDRFFAPRLAGGGRGAGQN